MDSCFIQILMSVVTEQKIAPKYVQTLMEVSFVNVTLGISWTMMGLHVMVRRRNNDNIYIPIILYAVYVYIRIYIIYTCIYNYIMYPYVKDNFPVI